MLKNSVGSLFWSVVCWRQPASLLGPRGPQLSSQVTVWCFSRYEGCIHAHTPKDKTHNRKHYCVSIQKLYADCFSCWTTDQQLCLYTQAMPLRETVGHFCLISSIGCLNRILITQFFGCSALRTSGHNRPISRRIHSISTSLLATKNIRKRSNKSRSPA